MAVSKEGAQFRGKGSSSAGVAAVKRASAEAIESELGRPSNVSA